MNMTTMVRRVTVWSLLLGSLLLGGVAGARELDVCHEFAEARYREANALDDSGLSGDLAYGDAFDDCSAGGRGGSLFAPEIVGQHESYGEVQVAPGVWRPTTPAEDWSADLDAAADSLDRDLIVCPWGSSDGVCQ